MFYFIHRNIWNDLKKDEIKPAAGEKLLGRCRQFVKLFVEEAIMEPQSGLVKPIQLGCSKVASDTGDISLVILLWEALFFGGQFEQEQYADMVLDSLPVILDHLDIDRLLGRCKRYRYKPEQEPRITLNTCYLPGQSGTTGAWWRCV